MVREPLLALDVAATLFYTNEYVLLLHAEDVKYEVLQPGTKHICEQTA